MSKLCKNIILIISFIFIVLAIGYVVYEYKNKKRNSEIKIIHSSYRSMVPDNLNSYPKIKEYYNKKYREGSIDDEGYSYGYNFNMIQLTMDMHNISMWCEEFSDFSYENYENNLRYWLDQEINMQDYQNISAISKLSSSVPPIQIYLLEYKNDKKITYREYCSLPAIFNSSTIYAEQLKMQAQKNKVIND